MIARLLALSALLLAGCGRAPVGKAFVDIDRVANADPLPVGVMDPVHQIESPVAPSESLSLEPLPARTLDFSENQARLEKVRAAVEEAREQTSRQLARKLRESYLAEIDLLERERLANLTGVRKEALERAWQRVRTRFLTYAQARAPHAVRLALYAGFPDPDPESKRLPPDNQKALQRRSERASNARTAITELDRSYEADTRVLLSQFEDEVADQMLAIRAELERMRADAEERAAAEARSQVAAIAKQIDSVLAGKSEVRLEARPGRDATIPAASSMPNWPNVKGVSESKLVDLRREAVRSDAKIWAAHHGLVLVERSSQATDRTNEFLTWRMQRQPGRSRP